MNQEHFEKLQAGVAAFNSWRESNPDVQIDLSGANLQNMNLRKVNLSGADLSGANLNGAKMIGANLSKANLHQAELGSITLNGVNLSEANLTESVGVSINGTEVIMDGVDLRNLGWYDSSTDKIIRKITRKIKIDGRMIGEAGGKGPYTGILKGNLTIGDKQFPARMELSFGIQSGNVNGQFTITDETDANNVLAATFEQKSAYVLSYTSMCDKGIFMGCVKGEVSQMTKPWNGARQEWEVGFNSRLI